MFGKVKLFFGIEGLKVDLDVPEAFSAKDKLIKGSLRLYSKSAQRLTRLEIKLVETYQRGRRNDKRINDYTWGKIEWNEPLFIEADGEKIIDFQLPFQLQFSSIEKFGHKSSLSHHFSTLAKWVNNAKSEFYIEVTTQVEGTALNPSVRKAIAIADGK